MGIEDSLTPITRDQIEKLENEKTRLLLN